MKRPRREGPKRAWEKRSSSSSRSRWDAAREEERVCFVGVSFEFCRITNKSVSQLRFHGETSDKR